MRFNTEHSRDGKCWASLRISPTYASLDAQITLDIMRELTTNKIAVIPVHDSFIVQKPKQHDLINTMIASFRKVTENQDANPRLKLIG